MTASWVCSLKEYLSKFQLNNNFLKNFCALPKDERMMKFIFNVCTHHFDKQIQNEKPKLWRCWGNTVLNCHHLVLLVYQVLGQDETIATVCQLTRHTTYLFYKVLYLHLPGNVISLHCCWLYYSTISFELHNVYLILR